jgi:hypothetical protein
MYGALDEKGQLAGDQSKGVDGRRTRSGRDRCSI